MSFDTTRRGYDQAQVDDALSSIAAELAELRRALTSERARADELAAKLASSHEERHLIDPTGEGRHAEAGARVEQIFRLAEEEAREARERVVAAADTHREQALAEATAARTSADEYARDVRASADRDAAAVRERAAAEAERVRADADAYADAKRREADAAFERGRARATLAMADFDTTMTARRDAAELAFTTRQHEADTALAAVEARRSELEGEAASILDDARAKAAGIEAAASQEADRIVAEARHTAERVRAASEQELAALAASRDAINAQLVDLRRTLNAFGSAPPIDGVLATEPRAVYETGIAGTDPTGTVGTPESDSGSLLSASTRHGSAYGPSDEPGYGDADLDATTTLDIGQPTRDAHDMSGADRATSGSAARDHSAGYPAGSSTGSPTDDPIADPADDPADESRPAPGGALDAMLGPPVEPYPHRELRGAARFHR